MSVSCKGKNGKDFDNNWWWWRPLARYCFEVAPAVCEGSHHFKRWTTNDGYMTAAEATELGKRLQHELDLGMTKAYEQAYVAGLEAMPDVLCEICNGNGKRIVGGPPSKWEILAAQFFGEPAEEQPIRLIECNGCHGYRTVRPKETMYYFRVENVQEFANFLKTCGGFEVL